MSRPDRKNATLAEYRREATVHAVAICPLNKNFNYSTPPHCPTTSFHQPPPLPIRTLLPASDIPITTTFHAPTASLCRNGRVLDEGVTAFCLRHRSFKLFRRYPIPTQEADQRIGDSSGVANVTSATVTANGMTLSCVVTPALRRHSLLPCVREARVPYTGQRTKLCRSELAANDILLPSSLLQLFYPSSSCPIPTQKTGNALMTPLGLGNNMGGGGHLLSDGSLACLSFDYTI
ncbi:hypothetical protein EVAR_67210_1 [Eumeta japonica]|uniref:Uncharacterized protein n=1 Tax=Eumeta variegata TaxID=151549 RepID=A0A4C2A3J3_EUMVA|nr:hypothetical protein EVAR_67210_1 [Eumeta japonica]